MNSAVTLLRKDARLASTVMVPAVCMLAALWAAISMGHLIPGGGEWLWGSPNRVPLFAERMGFFLPITIFACALVPMWVAVAVSLGDQLHRGSALAAAVPIGAGNKIAAKVFVISACAIAVLVLYLVVEAVSRTSSGHWSDVPWSWIAGAALLSALSGVGAGFLTRKFSAAMAVAVALPIVALLLGVGAAYAGSWVGMSGLVSPDLQGNTLSGRHYWEAVHVLTAHFEVAYAFGVLACVSVFLVVLALFAAPELAGRQLRTSRNVILGLAIVSGIVLGAAVPMAVIAAAPTTSRVIGIRNTLVQAREEARSLPYAQLLRRNLRGSNRSPEMIVRGLFRTSWNDWFKSVAIERAVYNQPAADERLRELVDVEELQARLYYARDANPGEALEAMNAILADPSVSLVDRMLVSNFAGHLEVQFDFACRALDEAVTEWDRALVLVCLASMEYSDCHPFTQEPSKSGDWCRVREKAECELNALARLSSNERSERTVRALAELRRPFNVVADALAAQTKAEQRPANEAGIACLREQRPGSGGMQ